MLCHIDESCFGHKRKYSRGRCNKCTIWVFGIVDTSTSPGMGYMVAVEKRDIATLQPIIQTVCRPGTLLYSDEWAAYKSINDNLGFDHETVCHKDNFVDPLTGDHTQAIESYWNKHKMLLKLRRGTRQYCLKHHLAEFMFRERHPGQMLSALFSLIAAASPNIDY